MPFSVADGLKVEPTESKSLEGLFLQRDDRRQGFDATHGAVIVRGVGRTHIRGRRRLTRPESNRFVSTSQPVRRIDGAYDDCHLICFYPSEAFQN